MEKIDKMKWLQKALAKKCCHDVYRDNTRLLATDGRRVHIIGEFIYPTKTSSINYGDYINVNRTTPTKSCTVYAGVPMLMKQLKCLIKLLKTVDPIGAVVLTANTDSLTIKTTSLVSEHLSCTLRHNNPDILAFADDAFSIGISASYLYDALLLHGYAPVTINYYEEDKPLVFTAENMQAIVSPIKLN